jgi:serine protease Do
MKLSLSLLPILLAAALPTPAGAALDRADFVALAASVLRVEAPRAKGGYALGSAVAVAPDKVVTNCHVTRDAREISVVRGGARWNAASEASDVNHDLCLLFVPGLQAPVVRLGRGAGLAIGQTVTALGYTGGLGIQSSTGTIVDLHRHDGSRVIQSSNWFSSGASGGGLFDDEGRLVGILTFRLRGGESHYFAAPADWVREMLDDSKRGSFRRMMPMDTLQLPYWQAAPAAQPRFLRAAVLLRDDRWSELASTAREWLHAVPDDAEPWYLLGVALTQLGRSGEARVALECALQLEPGRVAARERLDSFATASDTTLAAVPCRPESH